MIERSIAATVHGRFLLEERDPARLLVGFHGYAEVAESQLDRLRAIPGAEHWSLVSVQALHPFYTRSGEVVASWMTRLDRELAFADNVAYVRAVVDSLPAHERLVFTGFSQGAAMAARAAAWSAKADGLILLGGDIPPEVKADPTVRIPPTLLGRGSRDEWYTDGKFKDDLKYLENGVRVTRCVFAGGHEWSEEFRLAAGEFLRSLERA